MPRRAPDPDEQAPDPDGGEPLLDIGRITKAHGLTGEVVVVLTTDREQRLLPGTELKTDGGPLTVTAARRHHDRWIVRFQEITDRDEADLSRGAVLRAEPLHEDGTFWVHELVGVPVQTRDGRTRGVVEAVIESPASDLLSLDTGALVPVVFILSEPGTSPIVVDTPEGLFELFDTETK